MYTEKDNKKINILGTEYIIKFVPEKDLHSGADGTTDKSVKEITVGIFEQGENTIKDLFDYQKKVLRHELIHALLFESGLAECSGRVESWATNEEMVDFFAYQHKKLHAIFEKAGAL